MRCIFCKVNSEGSKSIEHIIPESLGNTEHTLAKGIVCDSCNQYFAQKIEKVLLESPYFKHVRHLNNIESKKGRIPLIQGIMGGGIVDLGRDGYGNSFIDIDNPKTIQGVTSGQIKHMIVPKIDDPPSNDKIISRFIGKVALETLAYRFYPAEGWNQEIVDKPELDFLRRYVRFGDKPGFWEYHQRRIYDESDRFFNPKISDTSYEVLHEFDFLYTPGKELFFVLVIMGIEYVINMADNEIAGYSKWLIENGGRSPIEEKDERKLIKGNDDHQWKGRNLIFQKKS